MTLSSTVMMMPYIHLLNWSRHYWYTVCTLPRILRVRDRHYNHWYCMHICSRLEKLLLLNHVHRWLLLYLRYICKATRTRRVRIRFGLRLSFVLLITFWFLKRSISTDTLFFLLNLLIRTLYLLCCFIQQ